MKHILKMAAPVILGTAVLFTSVPAAAAPALMPGVTEEMTDPGFWMEGDREASKILADLPAIEAINQSILANADCRMNDLKAAGETFDGISLKRSLTQACMKEISDFLGGNYYRDDGTAVVYEDLKDVPGNIDGAEAENPQTVGYGICVKRTGIRSYPTSLLVSDDKADPDFDCFSLSALNVGDPVLVKLISADENFYYCVSSCISGWVSAKHIALCKDKTAWLEAWDIPDDEALVVTQGKIFLEESNANSKASGLMLALGTVLRQVKPEEYDKETTNRATYNNYAVWIPVRRKDGSYTRKQALISGHCSVSEGYPDLTTEAILSAAFSMLGDAYGWGGMLSATDCSLYIRNIYRCFGFELPRNTTWQAEIPSLKYSTEDMSADEKKKLLDTLRPGTILIFKGHEMLYLGESGGQHYVISSVSTVMDPEKPDSRLHVRGVVINALETTLRANGHSWLDDITTMLVPYETDEKEAAVSDAAA